MLQPKYADDPNEEKKATKQPTVQIKSQKYKLVVSAAAAAVMVSATVVVLSLIHI